MTSEDGASLDGRTLAAAVEAVTDRDGTPDATAVRHTLERVTSDGGVDRTAVDEAVGPVALAVSNASDSIELASVRVESAREAATDAPDDDHVVAHLTDLVDRLDVLESRHDDLEAALDEAVAERETADLYEFARELGRIESEGESLAGDGRALANDAEDLSAWLTDADRRYAEFEADLSAMAESLDSIAAAADAFAGEVETSGDAGREWFGTVCSHRSQEPVLRDLHDELAVLRDWDDGGGDEGDRLAARLDELEARWERLGARLDEVAAPAWHDQYGPDVTAIESSLAALDTPVDFGEVRRILATYRAEDE